MAGTQTMTITVMYQTSDTYVYIIICWSSFKGGLYRACPYFYFSVEWWNGCWQCSVEARQWIWRLLALVLWLLFALCHPGSCHIMHSFQPCVSNRIVVLLLIIQQLHSVLIVILTCVNLIVCTNHYTKNRMTCRTHTQETHDSWQSNKQRTCTPLFGSTSKDCSSCM